MKYNTYEVTHRIVRFSASSYIFGTKYLSSLSVLLGKKTKGFVWENHYRLGYKMMAGVGLNCVCLCN